jgi:CBS domain containing-hemolysin-like protein
MATRITLEILLILVLVVANGVFAMAEIAIVSSRKARLRARSEEGDASAGAALRLAEKPDDFLSTVQIGITLVGILAGVFGGATIAEELGASFNTVTWIAPHGEKLSLALVVLFITYLSLVIGELVPKRIAASMAGTAPWPDSRPAHLGRIPRVADHFETGGFRVEVVDMDSRRVDKVLVSRHPPSGATRA